MNTLQQIIEEMEADVSRTKRLIDFSSTYFSNQDIARKERTEVLETYIPKLKLLLKEETVNDDFFCIAPEFGNKRCDSQCSKCKDFARIC